MAVRLTRHYSLWCCTARKSDARSADPFAYKLDVRGICSVFGLFGISQHLHA